MALSHKYESTVYGNRVKPTKQAPKPKVYYPHCYVELQVVYDPSTNRSYEVAPNLDVIPKTTYGPLKQANSIFLEPLECRVYLNDLRQADTFYLKIDRKRYPFNLHTMRIGGVRIYMFQTDRLITDPGDLENFYKSSTGNAYGSAMCLVGIIDEVEYENDASDSAEGGYYIINGTDLTGPMLQRQWPTQKRAAYGSDWISTIQNIVDLGTGWLQYDKTGNRTEPGPAQQSGTAKTLVGQRMDVVWLGQGDDWITLDQLNTYSLSAKDKSLLLGDAPTLPSANKAHGKKEPKPGAKPVSPTTAIQKPNHKGHVVPRKGNYWDVITSMCAQKGYEVFVRGYNVVIADPSAVIAVNNRTHMHKMVLGNNFKKYNAKKLLNKKSIPQIKTYWYGKAGKGKNTMHSEVYPDKKLVNGVPQQQLVNGIVVEQNQQIELPIPWCNDAGTAKRIAQMYYNDLARQQGSIKITTDDLLDLSDQQKDLLKLRVGYPMLILTDQLWDEDDSVKILQKDKELKMKRVEFSKDLTHIVKETTIVVPIHFAQRDPYYVKGVKFEWNIKNGISIDIELNNFINAKEDDLLKDAI